MVEQKSVSVLRRFSLEHLFSQGHATYQRHGKDSTWDVYTTPEKRGVLLLERARAREADRKRARPFIVAAVQSDWSASSPVNTSRTVSLRMRI